MHQVTISAKHLRAALFCAAKNDVRTYINSVCVEISKSDVRLISTDGCHLLVQRFANDEQAEPATIIIAREHVEALKISKKPLYYVTLTYGGETAELQHGAMAVKFTPMQFQFPDYRKVIPASISGEMAHYDPQFLANFAKVAETIGSTAKPSVLQNGQSSGLVTFPMDECVGVIMPLRGPGHAIPNWVIAEKPGLSEEELKAVA